MLLKRKYFKSTQEEFQFSTVEESVHLYIYKHNYPQIIVRFPSPKKTIIGYEVTQAQILYYPFYEDIEADFAQLIQPQGVDNKAHKQEIQSKIEKVTFPYKGELILNKEAQIFTEFLNRQFEDLIEQTRNPTKRRKQSFKNPRIAIEISQVFEILIKEWFNETFINAIFLVKQKHLRSFTSYDHGFLKFEVLKTSQTNMNIPFYKSLAAKLREIKQIENKHYYFEFQSSVLYRDDVDYTDVEKLGIVMPRPLSMNEFFFECLINMFHEFEKEEERKSEKKRREQERMRIKQTLLDNLRKMGVQSNLPEFKLPENNQSADQIIETDPLDEKLEQIVGKKKINKEEQPFKNSQVQVTQIKVRRQSQFQSSPQKREENPDENAEEEFKRKSQPRKKENIDLGNIKVIRSFTSEIIDDDFEQKTKRRFITKAQFDKILKFNEKIIAKRYKKELEALKLKDQNEGIEAEVKMQKKQEFVYVGVKQNKDKLRVNSPSKGTQKKSMVSAPYAFDFFSFHQDTIILEKKEEGAGRNFNEFQYQENEIHKNLFNNDSRNFETQPPIVIPGIDEISIIEKRGKQRHSKIKAIEFMYQHSNAEYNSFLDNQADRGQEDFNIDESQYD